MPMLESLKESQTGYDYYPANFRYHLLLSDPMEEVGIFSSLYGGDMEISVIKHNITYPSGESTTLMIPGTVSFKPITLSRGFCKSENLYNWFVAATHGHAFKLRQNLTIDLRDYDENGVYTTLVRWNLENAWPVKISGFEYNKHQNTDLTYFSIDIIAETILRADGD